jgi:predicted RNA-binding Zn ribbon-like protein
MERFGPTRRGGPVFRWLGEPLALDLANTVMVVRDGVSVDLLAAPEDLRRWLSAERGRLGPVAPAAEALVRFHALRDSVRELLGACAQGETPPRAVRDAVNAASAGAPVAPQLVLGPEGELRAEHAASGGGEGLAEPLAAVARSAIEIVSGPERERLGLCEAPSCGMFFLGSRRWCCAACGNRARAARHYRRTRDAAKSP